MKLLWFSYDKPLQRRGQLYSSESDVNRREIPTTKVDLRTVKLKIFLMALDP